MSEDYRWLLSSSAPVRSARDYFQAAQRLRSEGALALAASALDRAWRQSPQDPAIRKARWEVLDALAVVEHGLLFRYVPAGPYTMGSWDGEADEAPAHPVELGAFWLTETPVTWAAWCDLMGLEPPPSGMPKDPEDEAGGFNEERFMLFEESKLRRQYCESGTSRATDWHAHAPDSLWSSAGKTVTARDLFGDVQRTDPARPWTYDEKPLVCVSWQNAQALGERLSTHSVCYDLPTEAEWEKAARGGLEGRLYPWGDDPPTELLCDFNNFDRFSIRSPRTLPPNGYGLFGMSGGVWEWTSDWYDAEYYATSPLVAPTGPEEGKQKVLRGGSWADCAAAVRVAFRMGYPITRERGWGTHFNPNMGFRLCRVELP